MDIISETRLSKVHPVLAAKTRAMAAALEAQGIIIRVIQGLRTIQEQNAMYAEGRTAPGQKVTNAIGGYSWHNFGLAVDCVPGIRGEIPWQPNFDPKHPDFTAMIKAGEAQGLVSGSTWKSIPDEPHFQHAGIPVSPNDEVRHLVMVGDLAHVWNVYPGPMETA
jgi:peptidoglycan L-alanyl-D-glutamate endopeptidase CwlK